MSLDYDYTVLSMGDLPIMSPRLIERRVLPPAGPPSPDPIDSPCTVSRGFLNLSGSLVPVDNSLAYQKMASNQSFLPFLLHRKP